MKLLNTFASTFSTLAKLGSGIQRIVNAQRDLADVSYLHFIAQSQLATLRDEAQELVEINALLVAHKQSLIDLGVVYIQDVLEEHYRSEARAQDTQPQLMDEVARKEEVIRLQAAQIRALLAADDDSQAHIASLEATLLKNADAHAARALADDLKISGQAKEIAALSGKVKTLRADAAAALVSKVALEAQVATDAEKLRRRNVKIADLAVQISTHKQIQARVSAKIAEDSTTIAQQSAQISQLQAQVTKLKTKNIEDTSTLAMQTAEISELQAKVKKLKAKATATESTVVKQLRVVERVHSPRAGEANMEVKKLRRAPKSTIAVRHHKASSSRQDRLPTNADATLVGHSTESDTSMDLSNNCPRAAIAPSPSTFGTTFRRAWSFGRIPLSRRQASRHL
ncbi:hypothetical protein B0H13DRAFT_2308400 [Mycena leptocephala]|nr:hypothetical protein B0H13DRAFT_2308400 [Mycena leptocephala]